MYDLRVCKLLLFPPPGQLISHMLSCLEIIDRQTVDKVEAVNSVDAIYSKLFITGSGRQANKDDSDVGFDFFYCFMQW